MIDMKQIRQQFPDYDDLSDEDLVKALHGAHYSDIDFGEFTTNIGFTPPPVNPTPTIQGEIPTIADIPQGNQPPPEKPSIMSGLSDMAEDTYEDVTGAAKQVGTGIYRGLTTALDAGATLGSATLATPVAGIAGLLSTALPNVDMADSAQIVKDVEKNLMYQPRTEAVQRAMTGLGKLVAEPLEKYEGFKRANGDAVFDDTGSAALSTLAYTAPDAIIESIPLLGMAVRRAKGAGRTIQAANVSNRDVNAAIQETPIDAQMIAQGARDAFKEIETAKFRFSKTGLARLEKDLIDSLGGRSSKSAEVGTEVIADSIKRLRENPKPSTLDDIYNDINQIATGSSNDLSVKVATQAKGKLLDFMDNIGGRDVVMNIKDLKKMNKSPAQVAKTYKVAKEMWRRSKRLEFVDNLVNKAKIRAQKPGSNFMDTFYGELEKLRLNDRELKFFNKDEIRAIDDAMKSKTSENMARILGTFEFSNNKQASVLAAGLIGGGAAMFSGATGGVGALVAVGGLNFFVNKAAKKMTKAKAKEFRRKMAGAGDNGKDIVRYYLESTPPNKRNPSDLAKMLADPNVNMDFITNTHKKFIEKARAEARGYRMMARAELLTALTPETVKQLQEYQGDNDE